jgi:hypothetical protein
MATKFEQMQEIMRQAEIDDAKQRKGNKAAGVRFRKAMSAISKLLVGIRKESSELSNE